MPTSQQIDAFSLISFEPNMDLLKTFIIDSSFNDIFVFALTI